MRTLVAVALLAIAKAALAQGVGCRGANGELFRMSQTEYDAGGSRTCGPMYPEDAARDAQRDLRFQKCLADWYSRTPAARREAGYSIALRDCTRRSASR